jgi:hypothetical protein
MQINNRQAAAFDEAILRGEHRVDSEFRRFYAYFVISQWLASTSTQKTGA